MLDTCLAIILYTDRQLGVIVWGVISFYNNTFWLTSTVPLQHGGMSKIFCALLGCPFFTAFWAFIQLDNVRQQTAIVSADYHRVSQTH